MTRCASSGGKRTRFELGTVWLPCQQEPVIACGRRKDSSWLISLINYANCLPQRSPPGNHAPVWTEPNCIQQTHGVYPHTFPATDHSTQVQTQTLAPTCPQVLWIYNHTLSGWSPIYRCSNYYKKISWKSVNCNLWLRIGFGIGFG